MKRYFSVYTNKRMLVTLLLGFSSGIPLSLVMSTLQGWLAGDKIDIVTIGQFSLVQLPYSMKFLWAPFLDRPVLPFFGLRRGWMMACQVCLFFATIGLAFTDPKTSLFGFALMAFLVSFF